MTRVYFAIIVLFLSALADIGECYIFYVKTNSIPLIVKQYGGDVYYTQVFLRFVFLAHAPSWVRSGKRVNISQFLTAFGKNIASIRTLHT